MAKITSLTYKIMYTTVNHPNRLTEYSNIHGVSDSNRRLMTIYAKNLVHNETINKVWLYHIIIDRKEEIK